MTLKTIFSKPVNRPIEGVIKADDEASLRLEIEEYVLTNEVEKRLESFLDAYNNYEGANGVWVSGFFGSGKSHLLKMLALLLENREVDGARALDMFLPKCKDNEILRGDLKRAVAIPSKSILFNIDQKADVISKTQVDALLAVFVKVFDEMCGYYGKQGHIAQFERDLDSRGLYDEFKSAYESNAGRHWHQGREQALLESKNIARAYAHVTGGDQAEALGILDKFHQKVLQALRQAYYLSSKYHVVIANPPYMGGKGMNGRLGAWAKDNYPNTKSDLFSMFIERNLDLAMKHGAVSMITMQSWMFLSSLETLRARILGQNTILSMAHLGARAFDSIGGEVVSTTAFVLENSNRLDYKGGYLRLVSGNSEAEKDTAIREAVINPDCDWFYRTAATDFKKIPGSPIAYWVSEKVSDIFQNGARLDAISPVKVGLQTGNNEKFVREWFEVSASKTSFCSMGEHDFGKKWFPYNKGGEYRKWYGNNENVVNWENDGYEIQNFTDENGKLRSRPQNRDFYFRDSISWSFVSSSNFGARFSDTKAIFDVGGSSAFPDQKDIYFLTGLLCSSLSHVFMKAMNPTLNFQVGNVASIPIVISQSESFNDLCIKKLIDVHKIDWDSFETSWDFTSLLLLNADYRQPTLKATYQMLRAHWREMTLEMQRLEHENNRIFIEAYGLQDELTPEVPLNEITLTCNPHYRYGNDKSEEELEVLLLADTTRELVSYAVGCMFGRYALDKSGLILANQGETIEDYLKQVSEPSFPADDDSVIPMLDGDWFTDDIAERFRKFLRVAFGEEYYEENLQFVEQSLNIKGKRNYNIRDYFLGEFYTDHVKRYKKRPIYWLFSSPKGSFNALIYMHRYRPDTVSVVLNDYLREFRTKLTAQKSNLEAVSISVNASQKEKTSALKEIEKINKMITEMEEYEREELYPLATQKIEIDLDDGVKVNYPKFGKALKKIVGLDAVED